VLAAFSPSPTPFLVLMLVGFLVGTAGHLYRSEATIATGIGMILLATVLLPLGIYLADR
jgi:predicted benzoate:H+ symporter BenE